MGLCCVTRMLHSLGNQSFRNTKHAQACVTLLKSLYEVEVWMDILNENLFFVVVIYHQHNDLITLENMKEDKEQPSC